MRLNHAQRRALRLLDRGVAVAYEGLSEPVRRRLEEAGYVRPAADCWLLTRSGREAAGVFHSPSASVMLDKFPPPDASDDSF